ncbi:MAG TPA: hypothetical protein VGD01_08695 [Candidatus Elarobacter sp.]
MTAIVPVERGALAPRRSRRGAVSVLQFASESVGADVRVERVDRKNRCSWYAVQLAANEAPVTGRLVGMRRGGRVDELGSVAASPGSVSSARFAVTTPRTGAYDAMFLEIRSDELLLRIEAPQPPAAPRSRLLRTSAWIFGVAIVALGAGTVPLAFARNVNHGSPSRFVAPAVHRAATAAVAPASVQSFSARRDLLPGGRETVLASYLAVGERGTLALLDDAGTVITSAPFTRVGTVRLAVPKAYRALPMIAQITVHRGVTKAVSSVAVAPNAAPTAAPSPQPSPAADPAESQSAALAASHQAAGEAGVVTVERPAVAGRPLALRIVPQPSPMRIELEDAAGAVIAQRDVPAGAALASLTLPASPQRATYLLAIHYTRNGGEETVIRTIVTAPR